MKGHVPVDPELELIRNMIEHHHGSVPSFVVQTYLEKGKLKAVSAAVAGSVPVELNTNVSMLSLISTLADARAAPCPTLQIYCGHGGRPVTVADCDDRRSEAESAPESDRVISTGKLDNVPSNMRCSASHGGVSDGDGCTTEELALADRDSVSGGVCV